MGDGDGLCNRACLCGSGKSVMAINPDVKPEDLEGQTLGPRPAGDEPWQEPGSTGGPLPPHGPTGGSLPIHVAQAEIPGQPASDIPAAPAPVQGAYSLEQEQSAMRATQAIENPAERWGVQQALKREYSERLMLDGATAKMRAEATGQATDSYIKAAEQVMDADASWANKITVLKELVDKAQKDPRLAYGNTAQLVVDHLYQSVGLPNPRQYGNGYLEATSAFIDGRLSTIEQVLQMEKPTADGRPPPLTFKGGEALIRLIHERDKPDGEINRERVEFFKRYSGAIDPGGASGQHSVLGNQRIYAMEQAARKKEKELIAAGKNPLDIYDPDSKDFFGSPANISKYAVTMQQVLQYEAQQTIGGAAQPTTPSQPGESEQTPIDARNMTREEIFKTYKAGTWLTLPNGKVGKVPAPNVPMSR